jgi:MoaA/NifB/PqqE/SkfB family radical SAM enzyme
MPTGRLFDTGPENLLTPADRAALRQLHLRTNRASRLPKVSAFAHIEAPDMYGCGAGFQHLYIDAEGCVCPCDFTPISFGNIRQEPLAAIWQRLNAAFARPRPCCFLLQNAEKLAQAFQGRLPIPFEKVESICHCDPEQRLPRYYQILGWEKARPACPRPKSGILRHLRWTAAPAETLWSRTHCYIVKRASSPT